MKAIIKKDENGAYKELRKPSPMPYLATGLSFLAYGLLWPIASLWDYVKVAAVATVVFVISRGVWPAKRVRVELPPDTGDAQADQLLVEARDAIAAFRAANDRIQDAKVSACIEGIEKSCGKILVRLEEQPALYGQLRTFLRYYLPTTRKLLEARASLEREGMEGKNARLVCERTDRVLPEIERAFEKQLEALDQHRYLDLQVEIDVLEGMLKSDALPEAHRL